MHYLCVYCGSSDGNNAIYKQSAHQLGELLAKNNIGLVYGGGGTGLMGAVALAVLANQGKVIGIIPEFIKAMEKSLIHECEIHIVPDMHTRKKMMFDRADAFIALPGGIGTLEEIVEILTWAQLERHNKPILLLNINSFWQPLLDTISHMQRHGFIRPAFNNHFAIINQVEEILPYLKGSGRFA